MRKDLQNIEGSKLANLGGDRTVERVIAKEATERWAGIEREGSEKRGEVRRRENEREKMELTGSAGKRPSPAGWE